MKVVVLHSEVPDGAPPDEADVLVQAQAVSEGLSRLGHETEVLTFSFDAKSVMAALQGNKPDVVFNLVESMGGRGQFIHMAPAVLEYIGVPYTGSPTEAMFLTSNKLAAKEFMKASGIPTPAWVSRRLADAAFRNSEGQFIIKSVWEHASVGLSNSSVVDETDQEALQERIAAREREMGQACFAEAYIDGREFNLSLLGCEGRPRVLPPAEIHFVSFPPEAPRIVDYDSKWNQDSFAYHHTPRSFEFPKEDKPVLVVLESIAVDCWDMFGLRGYARVDFRVDRQGRPWVLEINANPCISPDSGFAAAAERDGVSLDDVIEAIVREAIAYSNGAAHSAARRKSAAGQRRECVGSFIRPHEG